MLYIVGTQIDTRATPSSPGTLPQKNTKRVARWLPENDIWELATIRSNPDGTGVLYGFMSWKTKKHHQVTFENCTVADTAIAIARGEQIVDESDRTKVDLDEKFKHLHDVLNPKPNRRKP